MTIEQMILPIRERAEALLATPEAFREWLEEQPAGSVVGTSRVCSACPLAVFLSRTLGEPIEVDGACVSVGFIRPVVQVDLFRLSGWPLLFIACVDSFSAGPHHCGVGVPREMALKFLARACATLEVTP